MTDPEFDNRWLGKSIPKSHWHFHRQLLARNGVVLAPGEFSQMLKDIRAGRALVIEDRPPATVVYMIHNRRMWERYFVLVTQGRVITVLPPSKRLKKRWRELTGKAD